MLNYKTIEWNISKIIHGKECLFRISAALKPQGRREQGSVFSVKHSALKTPSGAMLIICGAGPVLVIVELTSLNNANRSLSPG